MANNRMYIYCPECRKFLMLARRGGDGYYTPVYPPEQWSSVETASGDGPTAERFVDRLDHFFEEHAFCGKSLSDCPDVVGSQERLELRYESHSDPARVAPDDEDERLSV